MSNDSCHKESPDDDENSSDESDYLEGGCKTQ